MKRMITLQIFRYLVQIKTCLKWIAVILFVYLYVCLVEILSKCSHVNNCLPVTHRHVNPIHGDYHNQSTPNIVDVERIKFLLNAKPCPKDSDIFLTVCIISKSENFEERQVIRQTWASESLSGQIHFVFIVGESFINGVNAQIEDESVREKDIVLVDFYDSYRNLTFKSISFIKWSSIYCSHSKYILKIDDDIFVDVPALINVLKYVSAPKTIIGYVIQKSSPDRRMSSKWYVSEMDYIHDQYPLYISGFSYAISSDLLDGLLQTASRNHILPIEDIFITGICGQQAGARLIGHCGFNHHYIPASHWSHNSISIMSHKHSPQDMKALWDVKHYFFDSINTWFHYVLDISFT